MSDFLPWVEKYRPSSIDDIISHGQNITTIKLLLENNALPHLLFYGAPGTGKTSTIMAIANKIYGDNIKFMIMKLDASDDRGINSVREDIKGFAEKTNMFYKGVKLIILDEADAMTFDAQFALRRIIEKYSESIRFCLICNYENKIIPAIRSRCANFRFSNINIHNITIKLKDIVNKEKLDYCDEVIHTIAMLAKGDLRNAINLLQTISMQPFVIDSKICYYTAAIPTKNDINDIVNILTTKNDFNNIHMLITNIIKNKGYSLLIILKEIILVLIEKDNMINIIADLSDLENILTCSTFDDIYISAFISIFIKQ
jgi:replication factor C subunit 3/5